MINFWKFERENRQKSLFLLFVLFVFFTFTWWVIYLATKLILGLDISMPVYIFLIIGILTLYFYFKRAEGSIYEFLTAINALPIDVEDIRHKRVQNIVNEISVASGISPPKIYIFPSFIKNAFTVKTKAGHILGLSEGIASNMKRDEIQAIIGHEIGHIIDKDVELKTFIALLSSSLISAKKLLSFVAPTTGKKRLGRAGLKIRGRLGAYGLFIYLFLSVTQLVNRFLSTMISREREYYADMKSVEYTRNPEALARALYIIENDRIKQLINITHPSFATLFLINPLRDSLEEKNNVFSKLFTTHPPVKMRIKRLLALAHIEPGEFYVKVMRDRMVLNKKKSKFFYVRKNKQLFGPMTIKEIKEKFGETGILEIFSEKFGIQNLFPEEKKSGYLCPRCNGEMYNSFYEDIPVLVCNGCGGIMIRGIRFKRSLIREEYQRLVEQRKSLKKTFLERKKKTETTRVSDFDPSKLLKCPICNSSMARFFYSYETPVVIDSCYKCDIYFFDKGELDLLQ